MLLGARQFFERRGAPTPTARDYVQMGLVAMWDGIENAGWGTHNATASINWPSLIDATYSNRVVGSGYQWSFGTDGAKLVGARAIVLTASTGKDLYFDLSNDATICVCETLPQTINSNNALNFGFVTPNAARHFLGLMCGTDGYYAGYRQNLAGNFTPRIALNLSNGAKVSVSIVWHASTRTFDAYVGGTYIGTSTAIDQEKWDDEWDSGKQYKELIQSQFTGTWSTDDRCGTYHNLRVYSRALTAAEIAANYAIDKARFNLP